MQIYDNSVTNPTARYEFRIFGSDLTEEGSRLARLSTPLSPAAHDSSETYLLSRFDDRHIIKIREKRLDIKKLLRIPGGFEQWSPVMKKCFPVATELLLQTVFPALGGTPPDLPPERCTIDELIAAVEKHPDLQPVRVRKRRRSYKINDVLCETADVAFNDVRLMSICCEAPLLDDVKQCVQKLGLEGHENVNYLRAIKRMIGMSDNPAVS